jgi:uncharacterized protein YkwD
MTWNWIDLLLVLLVLLNVWQGWRRGFILELSGLVRWLGSLLLGLRFYQPVAHWLARLNGRQATQPGVWDEPLAFILVVISASLLIWLLEYQVLKRLAPGIHQRRANRVLGVVPGLANGVIIAALIAPLLLAIPLPDGLRDPASESVLTNRLAIVTDRIEDALSPIFDDAIKQRLTLRTVRPESEKFIELPFRVADPKPRPDLEARMLELVNRERADAGLKPLLPDPELTEVARQYSAEMFKRGFFSHYTPEGRSLYDRLKVADVRYLISGENLAVAPTLTIAHNGLMKSPGHRANILRQGFGRVGIGVMDGGMRGLMVTQHFRN